MTFIIPSLNDKQPATYILNNALKDKKTMN